MPLHKTLDAALKAVQPHLNVSLDLLMAFAQEDTQGGRDTGHFPRLMSPYAVEGQFLYALVRALRPTTVLEIGCGDGGSATHLLAALQMNQYGRLVSVDLQARRVGAMIPKDLQPGWELLVGDAQRITLPNADFVFEDASHDYDTTFNILTRVKAMQPRCVISHDYVWEQGVKRAFDKVFGKQIVQMSLATSHTETGMACWIA